MAPDTTTLAGPPFTISYSFLSLAITSHSSLAVNLSIDAARFRASFESSPAKTSSK
jgi:hypothetical protein